MSSHADWEDADVTPCETSTASASPDDRDPVYGDRLTGRNIRLLQLTAGSGNASLECRLIEASIDKIPPYEALSYVWGDASITEPIVCNGEIIQVTTNLANALRKVRSGISKSRDTSTLDLTDRYSAYMLIRGRDSWTSSLVSGTRLNPSMLPETIGTFHTPTRSV